MNLRDGMTLDDYSEKAVILKGEETRNHIDFLKSIHGRYIPSLHGWVFSKKRKDIIIKRMK